MAEKRFDGVTPELRENIVSFYAQMKTPDRHGIGPQLEALKALAKRAGHDISFDPFVDVLLPLPVESPGRQPTGTPAESFGEISLLSGSSDGSRATTGLMAERGER